MSDLAEWSIEHGVGTAKVLVNGVDVSGDIKGFQLECFRGEVPILLLPVMGKGGSITGTGVVEVMSETTSIDELDSAEIEAEALRRQEWGSDMSITQCIIEIIKEKMTS